MQPSAQGHTAGEGRRHRDLNPKCCEPAPPRTWDIREAAVLEAGRQLTGVFAFCTPWPRSSHREEGGALLTLLPTPGQNTAGSRVARFENRSLGPPVKCAFLMSSEIYFLLCLRPKCERALGIHR